MTESNSEQTNPKQPGNAKDTIKGTSSALDRAFPSLWILAGAIVLVIILIVLSGWKIVNLEHERAAVVNERGLLDRDKKVYGVLVKELPSLEDRKQNLSKEANVLGGEVQAYRTRLESLKVHVNALESKRNTTKAELSQLEAEGKAAGNTLSKKQDEIQNAQTQIPNLKQQVEDLKVKKESLLDGTAKLFKEKAQLEANIAGLEQMRNNKKQVLDSMIRDEGELKDLSKRFDDIAANLEVSRKSADAALKGLNTHAKGLGQTVQTITAHSEGLSKEVAAVTREVGNLDSAAKNIQTAGNTAKEAAVGIQAAKSDLNKNMDLLKKAFGSAEKQALRLAKTTDVTLKNFDQNFTDVTGGLESTRRLPT